MIFGYLTQCVADAAVVAHAAGAGTPNELRSLVLLVVVHVLTPLDSSLALPPICTTASGPAERMPCSSQRILQGANCQAQAHNRPRL